MSAVSRRRRSSISLLDTEAERELSRKAGLVPLKLTFTIGKDFFY